MRVEDDEYREKKKGKINKTGKEQVWKDEKEEKHFPFLLSLFSFNCFCPLSLLPLLSLPLLSLPLPLFYLFSSTPFFIDYFSFFFLLKSSSLSRSRFLFGFFFLSLHSTPISSVFFPFHFISSLLLLLFALFFSPLVLSFLHSLSSSPFFSIFLCFFNFVCSSLLFLIFTFFSSFFSLSSLTSLISVHISPPSPSLLLPTRHSLQTNKVKLLFSFVLSSFFLFFYFPFAFHLLPLPSSASSASPFTFCLLFCLFFRLYILFPLYSLLLLLPLP